MSGYGGLIASTMAQTADEDVARKHQRKDMLTDEDRRLKAEPLILAGQNIIAKLPNLSGKELEEAKSQLTQTQLAFDELYHPIKSPGAIQKDYHWIKDKISGLRQPKPTPAAARILSSSDPGLKPTTMTPMQGDSFTIPGQDTGKFIVSGNNSSPVITPEQTVGLAPAPITLPGQDAYKQTNVAPPPTKNISWGDAQVLKQKALARQKAQQEAGLLAAGAGSSPEQQAKVNSDESLAKLHGAVNIFKAINPDATDEEVSAYANSLLPGYAPTGNWKRIDGTMKDGSPYSLSYDGKTGRYRLQDGSISLTPPEGFISTEKSTGAKPQAYYNAAVNLDTAQKLEEQGTVYKGENGNPIDLSKLPKGSILVPVFTPGGKSYWSVATDRGRYETAGNQRLLEPAVGLPDPNAPSIGPARVGTTRNSITPGPNGPVTTTSTTTPAGGGGIVRPNTPPPPALLASPKRGGSPSTSPKNLHKSDTTNNSSEVPPIRDPKLAPMKGADERAIASLASSLATIEQQVVGRGNKPLWEYSGVLNNPDMLKAVNLAMAAPMLQTPEGSKNPGFWGTITTALGMSTAAQEATTDQIVAARNKVQNEGGPQAIEFLDRLAELKGTVPNLRKIQGGSSAMGAMQPLIQESPIMNISSPEDFRNRTANMLRTMAGALDNYPGVNKDHVNWLYEQADKAQNKSPDLLKKKAALMNAPTQKPDVSTFKVGDHVLYNDKQVEITKIHPDGTFEYK